MSTQGARPVQGGGSGGALYPNLLDDYSVISLPSTDDSYDVAKLFTMAHQLSVSLKGTLPSLESMLSNKGNSLGIRQVQMEECSFPCHRIISTYSYSGIGQSW